MNQNTIREFIQSKIVIGEGKISKNVLYREYVDMFPDVQLTVKDFINCIKEEGIIYKYDLRNNAEKGCFVNIQFNNNKYINKTNICDFIRSKIIKVDGIRIGIRIGKNQMFEKFKDMFPVCQCNMNEFITYIKNEEIDYNCDLRNNNIKGCFLNIQFNDVIE